MPSTGSDFVPRKPSHSRQMPANMKGVSFFNLNQRLDFLPVTGSGSSVHSQNVVTGTRQRHCGSSHFRQNVLSRLRTFVTGRGGFAFGGGGKPHRIFE